MSHWALPESTNLAHRTAVIVLVQDPICHLSDNRTLLLDPRARNPIAFAMRVPSSSTNAAPTAGTS